VMRSPGLPGVSMVSSAETASIVHPGALTMVASNSLAASATPAGGATARLATVPREHHWIRREYTGESGSVQAALTCDRCEPYCPHHASHIARR